VSGSIPEELLLARIKREREAREAAIAALAARLENATSAADQKITAAASKLAARVGDRTVESSAIAGVILRTQVEPGFASAEALSLLEAKVADGLNSSSATIEEVRRVTATQYESAAEQTITLRARFNANEALFRDQITAQASAIAASVVRVSALEATLANPTTGLAAAHARVGLEESARVTAVSAVASRASSLEAAVNDPATGLSATTARIAAEEQARATAVEAVASRTSSLEATINSPTSGVSAAHSRISSEEQARVTAVDAVAARTASLETTVNSATTGLAATRARILSEEETRAAETAAVATRASALEATVNNASTGVAAAHSRITSEEGARATAVEAVANRAGALESAVNNASSGLSATYSRIAAEETARSAADTALAGQINSVSATANSRNRTFFQSGSPTATAAGDLWIDTGNGNAVKRWNGSAWVDTTVASGAIGTAVSAEATARATADGNLSGKYSLKVAAGNIVTGMNITSATGAGADVSDITFQASSFKIHNGTSAVAPFQVVDGKVRVTGSLVLTSGDVSGLGSLATQNTVTAGQVSGLGALATQNSVASSQVAGLGSLATASSVDLSTQVTNKSLANLDTSANAKLAGISPHADVTLTAINGGLVITSGGLTLDGVPAIKSADYAAGSAGWAIKGNGDVEFSDGIFRGTVRAAVIDYAPLIGAGGPGLSAVMDWQHTGGENWRTDINDSNSAFRIFNSNATSGTKTIELGVGSRQLDRVKVWGDLEMTGYGYGDFTSYSSRELKENISPVGGVLSRLMQVRVVEFDWKNGAPRAGRDVGVIAEEIEEIFPLVVVRDRAGIPAVNYPKLCVYLLRALQELGAPSR